MINGNTALKDTIDKIHNTMQLANSKLKNATLLRNITDLRPILNNPTRWSDKYEMLGRFINIRDDLIKVSDDEDGNITVHRSHKFLKSTKNFTQMLGQVNVVIKSL